MNLEFRLVHIDMLSIPFDKQKSPVTAYEAGLSREYAKDLYVNKGFTLATRKKTGLRFDVINGFEIVRAAAAVGIQHIPCLIGDSFDHSFIDLLKSHSDVASAPQRPEDVIQAAITLYSQIKGMKLSFRKAEKTGHMGKKSTLYDKKRLAEHLDSQVQMMVKEKKLSKSAARSISYLPLDKQYALALSAVENNWTVRDINLARSNQNDRPVEAGMASDLKALEEELSQLTGLGVQIHSKSRHTGTIDFQFFGIDTILPFLNEISSLYINFSYKITGKQSSNTTKVPASKLQIEFKTLDLIDQLLKSLRATKQH